MPVRTGETYNFSSDLNSNGTNRKHKKYRGLPHWSCRHQKDLVINYRLYLLKYRLAVHIHHTFGPVSMLICLHSTDFTTIVVPTVTPIIQREIHGFRQRGIFPRNGKLPRNSLHFRMLQTAASCCHTRHGTARHPYLLHIGSL